jgi:hypothetical protein
VNRSTLTNNRMKVFLLIGVVIGFPIISNATLPGLSGDDAVSNILQDLLGGTQGLVRFLRGNTNRINGGGGGEIVDGTGSGVGNQVSSGYPAPKPVYGPPSNQETVGAVETQSSYLPPAPVNPQAHYGPPPSLPPVAPKLVYVLLPVQQTYLPPAPVNSQPHYGPPPSLPHVAPKPAYGPPVQHSVSGVETQSSYLPPAPVNLQPCYGSPTADHSSSHDPNSDLSESGSSGFGESGSSGLNGGSFEDILK